MIAESFLKAMDAEVIGFRRRFAVRAVVSLPLNDVLTLIAVDNPSF